MTGARSAADAVDTCLRRIADHDAQINAFIELWPDSARADAARADDEIARSGHRSPIHGMPIGIKDIIDVAGSATAAGSAPLMGRIAETDAPLTRRLREAGAVLVGKTTTFELALGEPWPDSPFPPTRNPWDFARETAGSSSGSAAAVAAGFVPAAIGSDTGGSVRGPAAWCGIVGFKPSYGLVDKAGVVLLAPSFDHIGVLARNVADASAVMEVIGDLPALPPTSEAAHPLAGLRFNVWREAFEKTLPASPAVAEATFALGRLMVELGAVEVDVALPDLALFNAASQILARAEGFALHRELLQREGDRVGPATRAKLISGGLPSPAELDAVRALRQRLIASAEAASAAADIMVLPTMPIVAPLLVDGLPAPPQIDRPLYLRHANCTGQPSISLPVGLSPEGLPIGVMLTAAKGADARLLAVSAIIERAIGRTFHPPAFEP